MFIREFPSFKVVSPKSANKLGTPEDGLSFTQSLGMAPPIPIKQYLTGLNLVVVSIQCWQYYC